MSLGSSIAMICVAACCLPLGCGSKPAEVTGTVTYNGQPVESGSVSFRPQGAGTGFGAQIVDGKYTATKIYPGKMLALIRGANKSVVPLTHEESDRLAAEARASGKPLAGSAEYIPEDAQGNKQVVDITGGQQTLDFAITGPPRK
jgi:hypothetical protein